MAEIVNTDPLILVLTQYGLSRIAEAMAEPTVVLNLTKIRFGSGENNEYYTPSESQTSLKGDLGLEFYVYRKELLEDGLTTSFYTMIPEKTGGFDIREVGLYETVDGVDYLFAVGTQQPLVKPTTASNYFIAVDYYIFLKSANLATVYDQIHLDSDHALVTGEDFEEMLRTFLFADANLMTQIGNNSRIIGYNRATQLYERMVANKTSYSYLTLYKNYLSVIDMATADNIFSFWVFDFSRRLEEQNSIVDLSKNENYLSLSVPITSIKRVYNGFMSMFSFTTENFFLSSDTPVRLFNETTNEDIPFAIAFALNPLSEGETRTLLAKSNYATNTHTFEFTELANRSLQAKFFTDNDNYVTFTSDTNVVPQGCHSVIFFYDNEEQKLSAFVNSNKVNFAKVETGVYTHMTEIPGTLYGFTCNPSFIIYSDSDVLPTEILNADGTPYTGSDWTIADNVLKYDGNAATYSAEDNTITKDLYAWNYNDGEYDHTVYTETLNIDPSVTLYNSDFTEETSGHFVVVRSGSTWIMQYDGNNAPQDPSMNIPSYILFAWKYTVSSQNIWANKQTYPTTLYDENGDIYMGNDWYITGSQIFYLGNLATYNSDITKQTFTPNLTSYITDEHGNISQPINSEVGLISIIKAKLPEEEIRALSLLLCATMGMNPYLNRS